MNRSESVKNINAAILNAQGEFPIIEKDKINPFYKSKYAPYDGIMKFIRPIIVKNNLLVEHSVLVDQNELEAVVNVNYQKNSDKETTSTQIVSIPQITVCTRITHSGSEEWKEVSMTMPAEKGNSHGIQGVITYIKRNNLILLLDIVVGDEDDDGNDSVTEDRDRNYQRPRGDIQRARTEVQNQLPSSGKESPAQEAYSRQSTVQEQHPKHDLEKEILDTPQQSIETKEPIKDNPGSLRDVNLKIKNGENAGAPMTDAQRDRTGILIGEEYDTLKAELVKLTSKGMTSAAWKKWLSFCYNVESIQFIKRSDYKEILETVRNNPKSIDSNITLEAK